MGKTGDYPVRSLISFDALENPSWHSGTRSNSTQRKTVKEMIAEIAKYHKRWQKALTDNIFSKELIKMVQEEFLADFIFHVNIEEGHGLTTLEDTVNFLRNCSSGRNVTTCSSLSLEQQETLNLRNAYVNLLGKIKSEEQAHDYGLLEASLLKETHRFILHDIPLPEGFTKPGQMSNKPRVTEFKGELYHYGNPEDMESAVCDLLDKYNFLFDSCIKGELGECDDVYSLFKTCSWLLFELLDLHPFSDGNGRLCRILCSYSLSKLNPFPTPIYNVWTNSSKGDYINALVEARKSPDRHPCALTTMIIECSYRGWETFFKALDKGATERTSLREDLKISDMSSSTLINPQSMYSHSFSIPTLPYIAPVVS